MRLPHAGGGAAAALLAAGIGLARVAAAQPARPACDSVLLGAGVAQGADTVYLAAGAPPGGPPVPRAFAASVVEAVADEFRMPGALAGAAVGMAGRLGGPEGVSIARPAFATTFLVELRRDGTVAGARVSQRSLVDPLDAAVYQAVRAADAARTLMARDGGPATLPLALRLTFRPDTAEAARPVAVLRQPRFTPAQDARLASALPMPRSTEARDGVSDHGSGGVQVAFEVVVDARGRPVAGTERLVDFNNPVYAVQLFDWLRHEARFAPATVGGCPVRQLVWWGMRAETVRR